MTPERGRQAVAGIRDPWVLLLALFGGGLVWAVGSSLYVSGVTAAVMLATAARINALTRSADESAEHCERAPGSTG